MTTAAASQKSGLSKRSRANFLTESPAFLICGGHVPAQVGEGAVVFIMEHAPFDQFSDEIRNGTLFHLFRRFNNALRQIQIEANGDVFIPLAIGWGHRFQDTLTLSPAWRGRQWAFSLRPQCGWPTPIPHPADANHTPDKNFGCTLRESGEDKRELEELLGARGGSGAGQFRFFRT